MNAKDLPVTADDMAKRGRSGGSRARVGRHPPSPGKGHAARGVGGGAQQLVDVGAKRRLGWRAGRSDADRDIPNRFICHASVAARAYLSKGNDSRCRHFSGSGRDTSCIGSSLSTCNVFSNPGASENSTTPFLACRSYLKSVENKLLIDINLLDFPDSFSILRRGFKFSDRPNPHPE